MTTPRTRPDGMVWASIYAARYDFAAVGAAIFSLFGFIAAVVASTHVIFSLFGSTYDAIAYGVALFLLAEGVAYYVEVYALFAGKLRWWLWVLRWIGPILSAGAGGLAVYGWLPEPYKYLAIVTTLVVPLFQWGFLSILMDRIRVIHARCMDEARILSESLERVPTVLEQLTAIYQEVQHERALDDLQRLREMIIADRSQPLLLSRIATQPTAYPTPVAVEATQDTPVATLKAERACPVCGVGRTSQAYAIAKRYDPEHARCTECRKAANQEAI